MGNVEDACGEVLRVLRLSHERSQAVEQIVDPVEFECRTEEAGEQQTLGDHRAQPVVTQRPVLEIVAHGVLVERRDVLEGARIGAVTAVDATVGQAMAQQIHHAVVVGAGSIHFVDEDERGHPVSCQESPQGLGVAAQRIGGLHDEDGVVEHAQRALHLGGEVGVARGVE